MEFDRPVFQYPLIGADGVPVPCATIADFYLSLVDALYWREQCLKEGYRLLASKGRGVPDVTCNKVVRSLDRFFSDMRACQIEEKRRRNAEQLDCQPTNQQLQTDITVAQNELQVSPSGLDSSTSAPQSHIPIIRQRFKIFSAMIR
jgi:hypothetical protein